MGYVVLVADIYGNGLQPGRGKESAAQMDIYMKDRKKILEGKSLSPLLLLRDQQNGKVVIAEGYHRRCAIYAFNEDALIQCKIV